MAVLTTIASIISIAVALASAGITSYQSILSGLNQNLRNTIQKLVTVVNQELSAGRLKSTKLLTLLQGRNQHALMTYLYNNPIISKSIEQLNNESIQITGYQNELQAIEAEIQGYLSQLSSLGYSQTHGGTKAEKEAATNLKNKLDAAQDKYDEVLNKMNSSGLGSSTVSVKPKTADIDAATQNVKGGLI